MISVSACLIVKNEEAVLERCLQCICRFADEIIIVDTGSDDRTCEIARQYTKKVYDFTWIDDFSAARNYSFSFATKEYIYVADADEVIDEENIQKILQLKQVLLPEIEIVQMYYTNQLQYNTTYNFDKEYRPKLYKRVREFEWVDPIHESVRVEPVIYDSEVEVCHMPTGYHANRDFATFQRLITKGEKLSKKLRSMYARELFVCGQKQDFVDAFSYFERVLGTEVLQEEELKQCQCVVARAARLMNEKDIFFKYCLKNVACETASSEVCYELGEYYYEQNDIKEAMIWFYNAAFETASDLNVHYSGDFPRRRLSECCTILGKCEDAMIYEHMADEWITTYQERNGVDE